jgi:replicative DNA helicase
MGVLERVGGRAQLAMLQESTPTAANVEYHARIVRDRARKRRLIRAGGTVTELGLDESLDADEAENQASAAIYAATDEQGSSGAEQLGAMAEKLMDEIDAALKSGEEVVGLTSGFKDLDRMTGGFRDGDLVIVAGRPSMGKSAWMAGLALHVGIELGEPVGILSLEMSKQQMSERMLGYQARVDLLRLHKKAGLSDAEYERLAQAMGPVREAPIVLDDPPELDELGLRLRARQMRSRGGIKVLIVDYLQLMKGRSGVRDDNRVQEVSGISRTLKAVARELRIPVVAISQLSRACEQRPDKHPILSDLRESGSLEQDADLVLFLYRDEYYTREKSDKPGIAEVVIAKHRNGPTGAVDLVFRKECARFDNLEKRRQEES